MPACYKKGGGTPLAHFGMEARVTAIVSVLK